MKETNNTKQENRKLTFMEIACSMLPKSHRNFVSAIMTLATVVPDSAFRQTLESSLDYITRDVTEGRGKSFTNGLVVGAILSKYIDNAEIQKFGRMSLESVKAIDAAVAKEEAASGKAEEEACEMVEKLDKALDDLATMLGSISKDMKGAGNAARPN